MVGVRRLPIWVKWFLLEARRIMVRVRRLLVADRWLLMGLLSFWWGIGDS